jgi:hypothetical protein
LAEWRSSQNRDEGDSKILTGIELEAALNPLEDQGYYFSSVRSTLEGAALANVAGGSVVVGANPRNARVWLGPSTNWRTFIKRVEALIDAAAKAIRSPSPRSAPLPVLALAVEGLADASEPYDMAIIVPEAISAGTENNREDPWLHEFSDAAQFKIKAESSPPPSRQKSFGAARATARLGMSS